MDLNQIINILLNYVLLVILITFHEFAHAWTAWKCGDDTARLLGRVSLNPIVHMELLGTLVLPLLGMVLGAADSKIASFIIGWGKPVPVNIARLRHRRVDDVLVSVAGPAMNLLLALGLMFLAKGFLVIDLTGMVDATVRMAMISLCLCFFNMLPIPPLDGSHVLKNVIGMSDELYLHLCRFGFIAVIILIQIPQVGWFLSFLVANTSVAMGKLAGLIQ